jgi:pimeloyl-ACP methyl ester carboxylesterase
MNQVKEDQKEKSDGKDDEKGDRPLKGRPLGAKKASPKDAHSENSEIPHPDARAVFSQSGFFETKDHLKLTYQSEGEGQPLVFLYGLVCSSLHWTYQIEHFRHHYQTLWFDYRGHNGSDTPEDLSTLTIEQLACDLRDFLDFMKIKQAVLLGHSMGVNVALEFARKHPDRVAGLVLANGAPRRPFENILKTNLSELGFYGLEKIYSILPGLVETVWKRQKTSFLVKRLIGLGGFNIHLSSPKDVDHYVENIADIDPKVFIELVRHYRDLDSTPWLDTITSKTMILSGSQDLVTPPHQQALLHQLLPQSELHTIEHGSHCTQMDLPELINYKIQAFLNQINWIS